jgi:hypothetical protein
MILPGLLGATKPSGGAAGVTWNPADKNADITLSGGNLTAQNTASTNLRGVRATLGLVHTGSGYFEVVIDDDGDAGHPHILIGVALSTATLGSYPGGDANGWGYYQENGNKYNSATPAAYGTAYVTGDVIGVAFKNGKVWFAKNNTYQNGGDPAAGTGEAFSGITGTIYPMLCPGCVTAPANTTTASFKTADFTYSPPSGFDPWEV